jgi:hypothetical protein
MNNPFFEHPILNSPYHYPVRHWELDMQGQPTQQIAERRRRAEFITPIPKPKKRKGKPEQASLLLDDDGTGLSTQAQEYEKTASMINAVRQEVDKWRGIQNPNDWRVTPETARLLQHWWYNKFSGIRPFFCLINDEAHHCYREKPEQASVEAEDLKGDEKKEAEQNNEAARLWISGLEAVNRKLGLARVLDLSATPFFLRGSGYAEGTLFPWTMSDFSLMDAIECGIVKLPRVPVANNIPGAEVPMFRNLWEHIRKDMPKKGRGKAEGLDPLKLPTRLQTALEALYGHYKKTNDLWEQAGIKVPPCFIVVCNNTSTSKLVYDYISGFQRPNGDGSSTLENGRLELFRNFDEHGNPLGRPKTLLIDSEQLESGEALDDSFRGMAADEIERFHREIVERTGDPRQAENITDQDLLREVMNTVGKAGRLGDSIRCVVSVSMLTEGWDASTVTHVLGVRAFGTQLLCEQVIGRALRRQSYELNKEGLFNVEYADVPGIPFDFTAKPVVAPPQPPRETIQVKAIRPDRDELEISFPRVQGYRVELPEERLTAEFNADSVLELTPDLVGPSITLSQGRRRPQSGPHRRHAPLHAAVPPYPASDLHQVARPRRGALALPVRPVEAHRQTMAAWDCPRLRPKARATPRGGQALLGAARRMAWELPGL